MLNELKGFRKIFAFTFKQHSGTKGYKTGLICGVLLCLLVPAIIMAAIEIFSKDDAAGPISLNNNISQVFVAGEAAGDLSALNYIGVEEFSDVIYTNCGTDVSEAVKLSENNVNSLVLAIDGNDEQGYMLNILLPENTVLTEDDASAFDAFIQQGYFSILLAASGMDMESYIQGIMEEAEESGSEGALPTDGVKEVLSMVIPLFFLMIMYFLVVFYGNSVAGSVVMEKSSKLMDNLLISVKPGALIVGKTIAIALVGIIQFFSWIAALIGGFILGTLLVKTINPHTDMVLILLFDMLEIYSGLFSVSGFIVAFLVTITGFLMYCSLSAVGASLASKPEDLSSTNSLFVLILMGSFFAAIYTPHGAANPILTWIPFTSVLMTPGQLILGDVTILVGLGVFGVTLIFSLLIMLLAGRLYKLMAFYRGDLPKPGDVIKMLKKSKA